MQTRLLGAVILLAGLLLLAGCQDKQENTGTTTVVSTPDSAPAFFVANCGKCHGDKGSNGYAPSLVGCGDCGSFDVLVAKIDRDMPKGNPELCAGECARQMATFIFVNLNGKKQ
ncbi:MAG: hypothetical protein A2521_14965 [Deltaproteobacteria bacterium RIFOXYD12_FULL_57_12]|nr:MAG: hypothetical protein A2521_14965 [Deltaproteobacteria bacterium RIFOXYD12_FULL_57_12]